MKKYLTFGILLTVGTTLQAANPLPPTNLGIVANSGTSPIRITWSGATDDNRVAGYDLLRNEQSWHVGNVTEYVDYDVDAGKIYRYRVISIDDEGNRSVPSATIAVDLVISDDGSSSAVVSAASSSYTSGSSAGSATYTSDHIVQSSSKVCIDTDGDGWGWNGFDSCVLEIPDAPRLCVDEDGDGWGWNGFDSCVIITPDSPRMCVDEDGDGWGWDGFVSCIP